MKNRILFFFLILNSFQAVYGQACFNAVGGNGLRRGCAPYTITATDCSGSGATILYKYSQSEGFVSRTTNTYTVPGIYAVTQALSVAGSGDSLRKDNYIEVLASPVPVFAVKYCKDKEVSLSITDTNYEEYIVNWGDGVTQTFARGTTSDLRHTYVALGTYAVTVTGNYVPGGCGGANALLINPIDNILKPNVTNISTVARSTTQGVVSISFSTDANFTYALRQKSVSNPTYQTLATLAGTGSTYTHTESNLNTQSETYTYQVVASDRCGSSLNSDEFTNMVLDVTPQNNQNQLAWSKYGGLGFQRYNIYKNNVLLSSITDINTTTLVDNNVVCKDTDCYSVSAEIIFTGTAFSVSNQVCVEAFSTFSPFPVTALNSSIENNNSVVLKWAAATTPTIVSHLITRYTIPLNFGGNIVEKETLINDSKQTAIDDNLDFENPTEQYCYDVVYTNVCGNTSVKTIQTCPVILTLFSNTANTINLAWTNYQNSESDYLGYVLEKLDENGNVYITVPVGFGIRYIDNTPTSDRQVLRYRIRTILSGGASFSYSNILTVKQKYKLFTPNVFTPNSDGVNDIFEAKGLFINKFRMVVYNRAGQILFTSNNQTQGWDGTLNGNPQASDVYVYIIDLEDFTGERFTSKGTFTLLR